MKKYICHVVSYGENVQITDRSIIKKYRKESGMSLMEVAEILDMSHDYLRRIESLNDEVKTCSLKLLIKFSILFDKKLDDFLKEEE